MKNARNSIIALALTALSAGSVFAADMTPKTRDQVRAELAQAQRDGTLIADGQTGATFRELNPSRYPAMATAMKSRADVLAELAQARANGTLIADGQTGATFRDLSPALYPRMQDTMPLNRSAQNTEGMQKRQTSGAM